MLNVAQNAPESGCKHENAENWTLHKQSAHHVELLVDGQHILCLYVLEENLFRVLLKRKGELALDRTWSIAPAQDVPWEGRSRENSQRL